MNGTVRATQFGYSLWEFQVFGTFGAATCGTTNAALNHPASASSTENAGTPASAAFDGSTTTRWSSAFSDPQWLQVDLGGTATVCQVRLTWEAAFATAFQLQTAPAATGPFTTIFSTTTGTGGTQTLNVSGSGRFVRMNGTARATQFGYSLFEMAVFTTGGTTTPPVTGGGDLGPNVHVFDPSMGTAAVQSAVDSVFSAQETNQFGTRRDALLFKPGQYNINVNVGFNTSVIGLGRNPDDVNIGGPHRGRAVVRRQRDPELLAVGGELHGARLGPVGGRAGRADAAGRHPRRPQPRPDRLRLRLRRLHRRQPDRRRGAAVLPAAVVHPRLHHRQQPERGLEQRVRRRARRSRAELPQPAVHDGRDDPGDREKPYLFVDSTGAFNVLVPNLRTNTSGATWLSAPTPGTVIPLSQFYVAKPTDTAATINQALAQGLNLLFTPGIYTIDQTINVTRANTVVLGIGYATLVPVNGVVPMSVSDVDGVKISGLLFDAGTTNSPALLQVGPTGSTASHAANPTTIQDVFFRIGGRIAGKATTSLLVNSNNAIIDHIWAWRADHGSGVGWTVNTADQGLIVNGQNVTAYGLFVEHYQKYEVTWNGNGGRTYFFQNEMPYDPPNQATWRTGANGYAAYKVADGVTSHEGWASAATASSTSTRPSMPTAGSRCRSTRGSGSTTC
jgi:hypothetical protein